MPVKFIFTGGPDVREAKIALFVGVVAMFVQMAALSWYLVALLGAGETAIGAVALWAVAALAMVGSDRVYYSIMGERTLRERNTQKRSALVKTADWAAYGLITSWATFQLLSSIGETSLWVTAVWVLAVAAGASMFQQAWNIARWREPVAA